MTIHELAAAAIESLNKNVLPSPALLTLIMPGKWGKSNRKYLAGPRSPQGQIVQETTNGLTVIFEATDILAWCVAQGVDVQIVKATTVKCYQCGTEFQPPAEKLKAWAESGRSFDPTDWECERCRNVSPIGDTNQ
jgi:hypothetical protein